METAETRSVHYGCVCEVRYHFVWCPNYRRRVLVGLVAERLAPVGTVGHVSKETVERYIASQKGR
jgi:REP element-mobilizing transposase RayT